MIRPEIKELVSLGSFAASQQVDQALIGRQQQLLGAIQPPVTSDEARELVKLFGPDDYYGGAWTVLHLIESAPEWPLEDCLAGSPNEWIVSLRERANRKTERMQHLDPNLEI